MKQYVSLFCGLLLLAACADPTPKPFVKQAKEVMHPTEELFYMDSLDFKLVLKPVPAHFIMIQLESDSFYEAHYFEDLHLVVTLNNDSFVVNKDSLLPYINEEYLNEARLEDVHVMAFDPERDYYLFEFSVRKPHEDFRYHFIATLEQKKLQILIDDE
ncbi:MAG TPA: hypothetical protein DIW47_12415 [Bacteroidetes bacterium]|nr:hypothetical protein [Bacteroidota bacterium]